MTANEYLSQLQHALRVLPEDEQRAALEYYEEYLSDAGDDGVSSLGTPHDVAGRIIAEYAAKPDDESGKKRSLRTAWIVIGAVFASPIALPIAIAIAAVAFAVVISLVAVFVSLGVSAVALAASGVACIVVGLWVVLQSPAVTLFVVGGGMVALGIGLLLAKAVVITSRTSFRVVARIVGKFVIRRSAE
ncbi:MAG: DUF1700 domain-containing protein [Oscillospiraceae bacterium]|jgi:uncharacterized membrane protein|nr:DUF1700 domain-containing protein [Oscillospiraceae bacterium]